MCHHPDIPSIDTASAATARLLRKAPYTANTCTAGPEGRIARAESLTRRLSAALRPKLCAHCGDRISDTARRQYHALQRGMLGPPELHPHDLTLAHLRERYCSQCLCTAFPFVARDRHVYFDREEFSVAVMSEYRGRPKHLFLQLKFYGATDNASELADLLKWRFPIGEQSVGTPAEGDFKPIIVPIPLSRRRQRKRGYNQLTSILEAWRGNGDSRPCDLLYRTRDTAPQSEMKDAVARHRNLSGAFALTAVAHDLDPDVPIVIFDDVLTTGATLLAAAKTLKTRFRQVSGVVLMSNHRTEYRQPAEF